MMRLTLPFLCSVEHAEEDGDGDDGLVTRAPRVGASFSTSRSEPGILGMVRRGGGGGGGGGGACQFWTVVAAALRGTDDFQALAFGLFSGKIPGLHSGSVLVDFRWHFRRLMRAFGGCFGRVLSSLSADEPVSRALSIVELSSQPVALKLLLMTSLMTFADHVDNGAVLFLLLLQLPVTMMRI